jgi:hypothetical protein
MTDDLLPADDHRERRKHERESRTVERFKTSSRGLRRVFGGHFPESSPEVEAVVYHLASAEAKLPMTREAIRLARYPGAGERDPRRFAMGLWENLSILHKHLQGAMDSLETLARDNNGGRVAARGRIDDDEDE